MSRAAVLGAIRRGLGRRPLPADQRAMLYARMAAHKRAVVPARGQLDGPGRVALFAENVTREFGTVARLGGMDEVPGAVVEYLQARNLAAALVVSPDAALRALPFERAPMLKMRFGVAGPEDGVCLTMAFAGVAETGTLMLFSGATRPVVNHLLPDDAIVLVRAKDILGCYEEAFDRLRALGGMPRNVMLVTGPSRSADIEQVLELGAHGPRRLHVLIVDGEG